LLHQYSLALVIGAVEVGQQLRRNDYVGRVGGGTGLEVAGQVNNAGKIASYVCEGIQGLTVVGDAQHGQSGVIQVRLELILNLPEPVGNGVVDLVKPAKQLAAYISRHGSGLYPHRLLKSAYHEAQLVRHGIVGVKIHRAILVLAVHRHPANTACAGEASRMMVGFKLRLSY
jgi:hypothetical protein